MIHVIKINAIQLNKDFQTSLCEGVLAVPKDKDVEDMPVSHFKKLIDKKGRKAIIRALTNLQNWFKYSKPSLSKWAIGMKRSIGDYGSKD